MHEERLETSVHSERIASEGAQTRHSIHHAPAAPVLPSSWIRGKKIDLGTLWRVFASLRKTLNQLGNAQKKKSACFTDFVDQGVVQSQIGSSRQRGEAFEKLLSVERKYSSACECDRNGWFPVSLHSKQGWIYFPLVFLTFKTVWQRRNTNYFRHFSNQTPWCSFSCAHFTKEDFLPSL